MVWNLYYWGLGNWGKFFQGKTQEFFPHPIFSADKHCRQTWSDIQCLFKLEQQPQTPYSSWITMLGWTEYLHTNCYWQHENICFGQQITTLSMAHVTAKLSCPGFIELSCLGHAWLVMYDYTFTLITKWRKSWSGVKQVNKCWGETAEYKVQDGEEEEEVKLIWVKFSSGLDSLLLFQHWQLFLVPTVLFHWFIITYVEYCICGQQIEMHSR